MLPKVSVLVIYILIPCVKVLEGRGKFEILLMLRCENVCSLLYFDSMCQSL